MDKWVINLSVLVLSCIWSPRGYFVNDIQFYVQENCITLSRKVIYFPMQSAMKKPQTSTYSENEAFVFASMIDIIFILDNKD